MLDLTDYGFTKDKETETHVEYSGHGFRVWVYDYAYKTGDDKEIERKSFVVRTKAITTEAYAIEKLESWLKDNSINKNP